MQYFTEEEYNTMIRELLYTTPVCFDTMLRIAGKTLTPYIRNLCSGSSFLRGRQYEDDIMQLIYVRMVKTCVTHFLCREDAPNDSPEEFKAWMFRVAKNIFLDFIRRKHRIYSEEGDMPETGIKEPSTETPELEAMRTHLNKVFAAALGVRSAVPKLLAWIALQILVLEHVETQIEANHVLAEEFSGMTMDGLMEWIELQAEAIPWIELDRQQMDSVRKRLDEPYGGKCRLGDVPFGETFRDLAMISDWTYRMNAKIKEVMKK